MDSHDWIIVTWDIWPSEILKTRCINWRFTYLVLTLQLLLNGRGENLFYFWNNFVLDLNISNELVTVHHYGIVQIVNKILILLIKILVTKVVLADILTCVKWLLLVLRHSISMMFLLLYSHLYRAFDILEHLEVLSHYLIDLRLISQGLLSFFLILGLILVSEKDAVCRETYLTNGLNEALAPVFEWGLTVAGGDRLLHVLHEVFEFLSDWF